MKNIWLITKTNIKRNKFAVLLSFVGAAMLCLLLWTIGGLVSDSTLNNISIGMIDYDQSVLSLDFKKYLTEDLHYNLLENYSYDELSAELIDKDISVIIEIPQGFYEKYAAGTKENVVITSMNDYENAAFIEVYINNYMKSISILSKGAAGNQDTFKQLLLKYDKDDIQINQTAAVILDKEEIAHKGGFINSVGFYLNFICSITVLLGFMVLDDRQSGVYSRIQITPVKPVQYIIGSGIFGLLLCFIEVGLYCAYIYLMDIEIGIPMHLLLIFMSIFSVFTVSFSLAIAVVMNSRSAMTSLVIGFSTIGCILGGAYFPIDFASKTLQNIAKILPQYWFMDAFRSLQEDITANIYPNITILALFTILSILIGAVMFSQNYKTK